MKKTIAVFTSAITLLFALQSVSYTQENIKEEKLNTKKSSYSVTPFSNIGNNFINSYTGLNSLFHIGGIASTVIIANTSVDYKVHNYFVKNTQYEPYTVPAVYIGYSLPLLGAGLFAYGWLGNSDEEFGAGCAVLQTMIIAIASNSILKAFTGRDNPDSWEYSNNHESRHFRFGLLRGGIHYGWPSGHLMTSTAVISCLTNYYPDSSALKVGGGFFLAYMFFSVIAHDKNQMHWFSDVVAGTLMGYAIGSTVGRNFRDEFNRSKTVAVSPIIMPDGLGICASFTF